MKVNLIDEKSMKLLRGMDVIFCRNVLIYFDAKAKQKAVSNLYDSLNPGGFLFIGTSESLHSVTRAFRPSVINKVIMYQKV
jgi:chemotaxis protein methyltransferase CheR